MSNAKKSKVQMNAKIQSKNGALTLEHWDLI